MSAGKRTTTRPTLCAPHFPPFLTQRTHAASHLTLLPQVGCCSLRTEHVEVTTTPVHTFKLDFLGKDSIRYTNEITLEKVTRDGAIVVTRDGASVNNMRAHSRSQVRKGEEQNFKRVVENIIRFKAAANARQQASQGQPEDIFECKPSELNEHLRVNACACRCARVCVIIINVYIVITCIIIIDFNLFYLSPPPPPPQPQSLSPHRIAGAGATHSGHEIERESVSYVQCEPVPCRAAVRHPQLVFSHAALPLLFFVFLFTRWASGTQW